MSDRSFQEKGVLATWPNQVYLHHGAAMVPPFVGCGGASWSDRPTHFSDIRYVRADLTIEPRLKQPENTPESDSTVIAVGSAAAIVSAVCENDRGLQTPHDPTNTVLQAAGFDESVLRVVAATWAAEAADAERPETGCWPEFLDTVQAYIVRAFIAGQQQGQIQTSELQEENARLKDLLKLMRGHIDPKANAAIPRAADAALAGEQKALLEAIEVMASEMIPNGAFSKLALPKQELDALWSEAIAKAGGRLLAPLFFSAALSARAVTADSSVPSTL